VESSRKGVIRQRTVRIHTTRDDLGQRIRLCQIDPFEGRDDGMVGDTQCWDRGRQPNVPAPLRRHPVRDATEVRQGPLAAGGCRVTIVLWSIGA